MYVFQILDLFDLEERVFLSFSESHGSVVTHLLRVSEDHGRAQCEALLSVFGFQY